MLDSIFVDLIPKIGADPEFERRYILADYWLESKTTLKQAAWELAMGQSIGNPSVRSVWETDEMIRDHACVIFADPKQLERMKMGMVTIGFPLANIDLEEDGVSQLICQLMGGQMDIDNITGCRLKNVLLPPTTTPPKYGVAGIREYTGVHGKPLLGGIVKPKVGLKPDELVKLVAELCEGGVNFIKEDEIMANPAHCPIRERTYKVNKMLQENFPKVIYATCINGDAPHVLDRADMVFQSGGNALHVNVWSGLGSYRAIRQLHLPLFIHFQKSGDRVFTDKEHRFGIDWNVICQLAAWSGVDFIHAGMLFGYLNQNTTEVLDSMGILRMGEVMPALSCGMHPGLVEAIRGAAGNDWMANVGGAIHGHPGGTKAGALAMRQAIDRTGGPEYDAAIAKWGKKE